VYILVVIDLKFRLLLSVKNQTMLSEVFNAYIFKVSFQTIIIISKCY